MRSPPSSLLFPSPSFPLRGRGRGRSVSTRSLLFASPFPSFFFASKGGHPASSFERFLAAENPRAPSLPPPPPPPCRPARWGRSSSATMAGQRPELEERLLPLLSLFFFLFLDYRGVEGGRAREFDEIASLTWRERLSRSREIKRRRYLAAKLSLPPPSPFFFFLGISRQLVHRLTRQPWT